MRDEVVPVPVDLRRVKISPLKKLMITGIDGRPLGIRCKSPTEAQKAELLKAFSFIDERLRFEEYRQEVRTAMNVAGIMITGNPDVVAYAKEEAIILNKNLLDRSRMSFDEFVVTILHELLHILDDDLDGVDKTADSESEAQHDLLTYSLLNIDVPPTHWAFKKYPHLLGNQGRQREPH